MALLPWHKIETVLLDMDGTLLDLHFDNRFWIEHIPKKLAEMTSLPLEQCRAKMEHEYAKVYGQIQWYCLDYWAETLQLDIVAAKRELMHLIELRDDCIAFLDALKSSNRKIAIVTNAHPGSLGLKLECTGLHKHVDTIISSHRFGVSKESQSLWRQLHEYYPFDPAHTLFVDDSERILDAASEFGIVYTLGVANPDKHKPAEHMKNHKCIEDYRHFVDDIYNHPFSGRPALC